MTCLDVNLLLYATNPLDPKHERVRLWFEDQLNSGRPVGLPWAVLASFVRQSTLASIRNPPLSMQDALEIVEEWLGWPTVWTPVPTARHAVILAELLRRLPRNKLVNDAHLATLAIEHGLTMCSADHDFRLFPGLKLLNPLDP